jgi:hypothetical protein
MHPGWGIGNRFNDRCTLFGGKPFAQRLSDVIRYICSPKGAQRFNESSSGFIV